MCRLPVFALRNSCWSQSTHWSVCIMCWLGASRFLVANLGPQGGSILFYVCPCWKVNLFKEFGPYKDSNRTSKLGFWVQKLFLAVHHLPHVQGFIWWHASQLWLWRQSTAITTCQVEWQTNCRWWFAFFCHSYLFLCQHQQPAQSSLACHIQLAGDSACLVEPMFAISVMPNRQKKTCRWSRILGLYFNQIYFGTP